MAGGTHQHGIATACPRVPPSARDAPEHPQRRSLALWVARQGALRQPRESRRPSGAALGSLPHQQGGVF